LKTVYQVISRGSPNETQGHDTWSMFTHRGSTSSLCTAGHWFNGRKNRSCSLESALSGDQHRVSTCLITPAALHDRFLVQASMSFCSKRELPCESGQIWVISSESVPRKCLMSATCFRPLLFTCKGREDDQHAGFLCTYTHSSVQKELKHGV
jgi:hypothetical protein